MKLAATEGKRVRRKRYAKTYEQQSIKFCCAKQTGNKSLASIFPTTTPINSALFFFILRKRNKGNYFEQ